MDKGNGIKLSRQTSKDLGGSLGSSRSTFPSKEAISWWGLIHFFCKCIYFMVACLGVLETHDQIQILMKAELISSWYPGKHYMASSIGYSSAAQFGCIKEMFGLLQWN